MAWFAPFYAALWALGIFFTFHDNLDSHHCKFDRLSGFNYCMPKDACWISNYDHSVTCYRVAKLVYKRKE